MIDYALWNLEQTKIVQFKTLKIDESDILDMMKQKFDNDELPISIHISKDNVIPEFSIDSVTS